MTQGDFLLYLKEKNFSVYYELCPDNSLNFILYCSPFQKYVADEHGIVMFFDTIVQTNKYNRPRGTFSIQLNNGRLVPVLHCIMSNQESATFEKIFNIGLKRLILPPKTLLTDEDPAILKAFSNSLKDLCYHVICGRHSKENTQKHIAPLLSPNCFTNLNVEEKIKLHAKILGLYNCISKGKANEDIEYVNQHLPEGEIKKYFLTQIEKKSKKFPAFISAFTGGHFTTNPAESINNITRGLKKSSEICEEISLLQERLPGPIYNSNIKLTVYQKDFVEKKPILKFYKKNLYTDYALKELLNRFADSQEYEVEKKELFIEVFKFGNIQNETELITYRKDMQKVCFYIINNRIKCLGEHCGWNLSMQLPKHFAFKINLPTYYQSIFKNMYEH